ncbi:uncharacterized protein LOC123543185 [Mercenaria mercenaria]|uniref:uncharacterized protein LOC123543185 n=1 Tax=Mercenaria mercenaria TaxID=6596 RepID=UPI00234E6C57|nr:uncharacterized protein LOC123543185 [Mercenaria mercenaria]
MAHFIRFGFLVLALHLTATEAIQCLSCDSVVEARDCRRLVTCGSHEICYVRRLIATNLKQYYKLGCTDKNVCIQEQKQMFAIGKRDTNKYSSPAESGAIQSHDRKARDTNGDMTLCLQCCESADGCNKDLCGSPPTTNRRCLTCDDVLSPKDCERLQECSRDEFCYVHKGINQNIATFEIRHDLGCMGERQCNALKLAYPQACVVCCNQTDLCNYAACDKWMPAAAPTQVAFTTRPTTKATTTIPTTPPPQVVINGPDKDNYMNSTQLTCVTSPPAQSYTWKFNGTGTLPKGITSQQIGIQAGSVAGVDTLQIASLTEAQMGTYTCVATINGQTVEQSHFLGINGEKPTVHIEKPPVSNNFAMQCQVTGYPVPLIKWDFIPDSAGSHGIPPGVEFSDEKFQSTLFVKTYNPTDHTGMWYCKASNVVGNALAQVHVP